MNGAVAKASALAAARAAGAGAARVCSAAVDREARARFEESVERGDVSTWPYDRAYASVATAPESLLPGARSVLCFAVPFATPAARRRAPSEGRISNYAWSPADYHLSVRRVLEAASASLDAAAGGAVTRIVCDTAPLAERAFAARAGLGWVGKHTNLIAPGLGSFVFLGEVVTTLELPEDPPLRKTCGACARCVDACPTGALRGDYTMDATRCISDLTQRRDAIPADMRVLIGEWFWGCDLCQDICPPTARAGAHGSREFMPSSAGAFVDAQAVLGMSGRALRRAYGGSALGWRGPAVLRRNAAVVLGNALDRAAVPALASALFRDSSPMVRGHAAWALGRIGSPQALSALSQAAAVEASYDVRGEVARALEPYAGTPTLATPEVLGR